MKGMISKKQAWLVAGLMVLSAAVGAFLMIGSDSMPFGLAGPDDVKLGAEHAPVVATNEVQALNDAYVAVSEAVTPQVVYITVTTEVKATSRGNGLPFEDPFGFFEFPQQQMPRQGSGSGVIVTSDGYILTNNHVVKDASESGIQVELHDGSQYPAKLIGKDPTTDLAVIKIEADGLAPATIGSSESIEVGQIVFAVGNPLGLTSTVTQGIVSAIGRGQLNLNNRADGGYGIEDFIQTDAAINPGNSGGGLFNLNGELVGINSAIATNTGYSQGYGFAIPIDLTVSVAKDLIEDGQINRGYIGVMIKSVDHNMAKYHDLEPGTGVFVDNVQDGGAAASAGIKQGDIILEVNGETVNSANQLQSKIAQKRVGDKVRLKLYRYGETIEKTITLKPRPDAPLASANAPEARGGQENSSGRSELPSVGMEVEGLSAREKQQLGIRDGVLVRGVEVYGEAFTQGVREGDIILSVNRKEVNAPDEVAEIIGDSDAGDVVLLEIQRRNGMKSLVALEVQ